MVNAQNKNSNKGVNKIITEHEQTMLKTELQEITINENKLKSKLQFKD